MCIRDSDKAQALFDFYQSFEAHPVGRACESYDGIAFKYLDWSNLSDEAKAFGESHLVVLSALYGVVEQMCIRDRYGIYGVTSLACTPYLRSILLRICSRCTSPIQSRCV